MCALLLHIAACLDLLPLEEIASLALPPPSPSTLVKQLRYYVLDDDAIEIERMAGTRLGQRGRSVDLDLFWGRQTMAQRAESYKVRRQCREQRATTCSPLDEAYRLCACLKRWEVQHQGRGRVQFFVQGQHSTQWIELSTKHWRYGSSRCRRCWSREVTCSVASIAVVNLTALLSPLCNPPPPLAPVLRPLPLGSQVKESMEVHCGFAAPNSGFRMTAEDKEYLNGCQVAVVTASFGGGDFFAQPIGISKASLEKVEPQ